MRRVKIFKVKGNSLRYWTKVKNPINVVFNFLIIFISKYLPSLELKNFLYRMCGINIGKNCAIGLGATFDIFFPELIKIGENSLIGYNTTILTHEFLIGEWRKGKVEIGKNSLIGANCLILPGVKIGDNSIVASYSLVNRDVKPYEFVGGIPIKTIKKIKRKRYRKR